MADRELSAGERATWVKCPVCARCSGEECTPTLPDRVVIEHGRSYRAHRERWDAAPVRVSMTGELQAEVERLRGELAAAIRDRDAAEGACREMLAKIGPRTETEPLADHVMRAVVARADARKGEA